MELNHSSLHRTRCLSRSESSSFDIRERHITRTICCRLFYKLDTCVRHRNFSDTVFVKKPGQSFQHARVPTKAEAEVALWGWRQVLGVKIPAFCFCVFCSFKLCFSLIICFINKPFHLNTSVNCMHSLVFCFFLFGAMFLYEAWISHLFLHCNCITSLFDLFYFRKSVWFSFCQPSLPPPVLEVDPWWFLFLSSGWRRRRIDGCKCWWRSTDCTQSVTWCTKDG